MNLNFVKEKENLYRADFAGDHILELYKYNNQEDDFFKAYDFNPEKNTLYEIAPDIKKYSSVYIENCIYDSDKFFFASCSACDDKIKVSLYAYNFKDTSYNRVFDVFLEKEFFEKGFKIKIFALNLSNFLIQTERIISDDGLKLMGLISFKLTLYNTDRGDFSDIEIPDFVNNGINTIIPVAENKLAIKCGYSYIEDDRIEKLVENEALIESIYVTSAAQLIADISINKSTGSMKLIDTAYFDKCISAFSFKDDFLIYKLTDAAAGISDINFVNINTFEKIKYRPASKSDFEVIEPLVIRGVPYIKIKDGNAERFINLKMTLEDMEFPDENLCSCPGSILIFSKERKNKKFLRIYSYPNLTMLYEEKCTFGRVCSKNDEYYIYFR